MGWESINEYIIAIMRSSEWRSFQRCLAIVQRLQTGPASSSQLLEYVITTLGDDCYPPSLAGREKAFKHDRESLRNRLSVDFYYDPSAGNYILLDPGPFFKINFSQASVRAIALLSQTFSGQLGERSEIQTLIEELISRLPLEARRKIENQSLLVNIELLQQVDSEGISERIWTILWRAVREHRKLRFNYISPHYIDCEKRLHEVIPYRIQFQGGHWYLRGYRDYRRDTDGQIDRSGVHARYRLNYIQDDDQLQVSPKVISNLPKPPKYLVHYQLLPPLSQGLISKHFDEMEIKQLAQGGVEIKGYTGDAWEAGRILLSYGEYCNVLGGTEVRSWILKTVRGMTINYSTEL